MPGSYSGQTTTAITLNTGTPDVTFTSAATLSAYGTFGSYLLNVGSSLAPHTVFGAAFGPAGAAFNVVNDGLIETSGAPGNVLDIGIVLAAGSLENSGTILGESGAAIFGASAYIENSGTMVGSTGVGIFLDAGGLVRNMGSISGAQTGVELAASTGNIISNASSGIITSPTNYAVELGGGTVVNAGKLLGNAGGVHLLADATVENSGTVEMTGAASATNNSYAAINAQYDARIFNTTGGYIAGENGIFIQGTGASYIDNAGRVLGHTADGIDLQNGRATIENAGVITTGETKNNSISTYAGIYLRQASSVFNSLSGSISGPIGIRFQGSGANYLDNAGTLYGKGTAVYFNYGGTAINTGTILATHNGVLAEAIGGYGFGSVVNAGLIEGIGTTFTNSTGTHKVHGIDLKAGGDVTNEVSGTIEAAVGVYLLAGTLGQASAINLDNQGLIRGTYHSGVALGSPGYVRNSGSIYGSYVGVEFSFSGSLYNAPGGTISGGHAAVYVLDGTISVDNAGVLLGMQAVDAAAGAVVSLTNTGKILSTGTIGDAGIKLRAGGDVVNDAGTISGATAIADSGTSGATLSVFNQATLAGTYYGIYDKDGPATITNAGDITATDQKFRLGTVMVGGAGIALYDGGTVENEAGATLIGYNAISDAGAPLTLINDGFLQGGGSASIYSAVYLDDGGSVINRGTVLDTSSFAGAIYSRPGTATTVSNYGVIRATAQDATGVFLSGPGSVTNAQNATIYGYGEGVGFGNALAALNNAGTIFGTGVGVQLYQGGLLSNASTGTIASAQYAVLDQGQFGTLAGSYASTLINNGFITAPNAIGLYAHLNDQIAITNGGTILAVDDAINFYGSLSGTGTAVIGNDGLIESTASIATYGTTTYTPADINLLAGAELINGLQGSIIGAGIAVGVFNGTGFTSINNDGLIAGALVGVETGNTNSLAITNEGSILSSGGDGINLISDGRVVNAFGGFISGADYAVQVNNANAYVSNAGVMNGHAGILVFSTVSGSATVINSGTIDTGGTAINLVGSFSIAGSGIIRNYGLIETTGSSEISGDVTFHPAAIVIDPGTTLLNAGTIIGVNDGIFGAGTIIDNGLIVGANAIDFSTAAARLILEPGASIVGAINNANPNGDVLELAQGSGAGAFDLGATVSGFGTIEFDAGASWSLSGAVQEFDQGQTITGFALGDTLTLEGFSASSDSYVTGTGLELGGGVTLDLAGDFATNGFEVLAGPDATTLFLCYLRGTRIATPEGERPVEDLRAGDAVITQKTGVQNIRWIGEQHFHNPAPDRTRDPVRIKTGALGDGVPARDLWVSPGHSIWVADNLVLARNLVNGITITQDGPLEEISYFGLELPAHDCVSAEGAWAESFADGPGLRAAFHNFQAFLAANPDYREPEEIKLCAPRPEAGPDLAAALAPVLARAAAGIKPGNLRGSIDLVGKGVIEGWAQDETHPELPVWLEIYEGPVRLGRILACEYREDLAQAGIGAGRAKFRFEGDRNIAWPYLRVRRAGDGAEIFASAALLAQLWPKRAA